MASITNREAAQAPGWVIYDFGMNNGDDVAYYLLKADRVVGVDANPELCREVRTRFAGEIASGRVTVLNVALAERETAAPITFYVHKTSHVLSRLPEPPADLIDQFTPIQVPCRTPASIVREFGDPLYVKIDVEGFDSQVLQNLFAAGVFPPEISAESHSATMCSTWSKGAQSPMSMAMRRSPRSTGPCRSGSRKIPPVHSEKTSGSTGRTRTPSSAPSRFRVLDGETSMRRDSCPSRRRRGNVLSPYVDC